MEPQISEVSEQIKPEKNYNIYVISASIIGLALLIGAIIISLVILFMGRQVLTKLNSLSPSGSVATSQTQDVPTGPVDIEITENMPRLGNADAPVVLVEYADYQCPFCELFFKESFPNLKRDYIDTGKVRFYYQDFPFLGEESQFASEAAKCAKEQGKFWEYHDYLYTHQDGENKGAFAQANLKKFAADLGLDKAKFNNCVDSRVYKPDVEAESNAGQGYGVSATPTVFINGVKFEGAKNYEVYKQAIEKALQN